VSIYSFRARSIFRQEDAAINTIKVLKRSLANLPGWRTSRKIVVFVSDDWGSIRTPSNEALENLRQQNVDVDKCHYMLFDRLESGDDLEMLFGLLEGFADKNGKSPALTANCLVANPDFDRIKQSDFSEYHSESVIDTYAEAQGCENNMTIWEQAIERRVCLPQSHGREHLNIARWMASLQKNERIARAAFDHRMFGVSSHTTVPQRLSTMAAFDCDESGEGGNYPEIISEALDTFRDIYGYASRSFIAPNYVWDETVERAAKERGVDYIQSGPVQIIPGHRSDNRRLRRHFQGQRNRLGQRYLVRNVQFEPSSDSRKDWVGQALLEMEIAFRFRKPAVISMHRVNLMGALSPENRDRGLMSLKALLSEMVKRWPDLEFLDAVELGDAMPGDGRSL